MFYIMQLIQCSDTSLIKVFRTKNVEKTQTKKFLLFWDRVHYYLFTSIIIVSPSLGTSKKKLSLFIKEMSEPITAFYIDFLII